MCEQCNTRSSWSPFDLVFNDIQWLTISISLVWTVMMHFLKPLFLLPLHDKNKNKHSALPLLFYRRKNIIRVWNNTCVLENNDNLHFQRKEDTEAFHKPVVLFGKPPERSNECVSEKPHLTQWVCECIQVQTSPIISQLTAAFVRRLRMWALSSGFGPLEESAEHVYTHASYLLNDN